jgi:hypothetical protein
MTQKLEDFIRNTELFLFTISLKRKAPYVYSRGTALWCLVKYQIDRFMNQTYMIT